MRAVVVGGGIGGLATGIALRRVGVEVVILERAEEVREIGAGISVWVNAMRALEKIGVADAVRRAGNGGIGGTVRLPGGEVLAEVPAEELEGRFGESIVLTRPDLQQALLAALDEAGGELRLGSECLGFRQDSRGVAVEVSGGQELQCDLLVGADGLHSAVRARLFGAEEPRYAGFTAWRGLAGLGEARDDGGFEAWGRGRIFGLVSLGGGRFYWYATKNAPEGQPDARGGRKGALLDLFGRWRAPVPDVIRATDEAAILHNDVYYREPLERWGTGRVTLLGDAAHPMTPNLGQGACQAIEDAVALAESVRERGSDVEGALRLYEGKRKERAALISRRSRLLSRAGQLENGLLRSLRNAVVRVMPLSVQLRQLDPILSHEP